MIAIVERLAKTHYDAGLVPGSHYFEDTKQHHIRMVLAILRELREAVTEEMLAALKRGYLSTIGPEDTRAAFQAALDVAMGEE